MTMTGIKRRHQHALFLCHAQLFTHNSLHPPPLEKDLDSLNQHLYLSPLLSLRFVFCWNFFNSQLSFVLEDNLLLVSGGYPDRNCWDPWNETGSKWERPTVTRGV